MSKTKNKTHSQTEHLQGEIKRLKSVNRQLRKRLKELDRKSHFYEEVVEEVSKKTSIETCLECGKGEVTNIDFVHLTLKKCLLCGHQQRIPKNGKKKAPKS